jgi:hypothetical protein
MAMNRERSGTRVPTQRGTITPVTPTVLINTKTTTQVSYSFVLFYTQPLFGRGSFKGATTLSIMTFSLMALSMRGLHVALSISNSQHK